jgi:hypothetical protein
MTEWKQFSELVVNQENKDDLVAIARVYNHLAPSFYVSKKESAFTYYDADVKCFWCEMPKLPEEEK